MKSLPLTLSLMMALAMPAAAQAQARVSQPAAAGLNRPAAAQALRDVEFVGSITGVEGTLVIPASSQSDLEQRVSAVDAATLAGVTSAIKSAEFTYGAGSSLSLRGIGSWRRVLVIGLGEKSEQDRFQRAGMIAGRALMHEAGPVSFLASAFTADQAADLAAGFGMGEYRADLYGTADRKPSATGKVSIVAGANAEVAESTYATRGKALVKAIGWARDISNEPANVVYPEVFVERARAAFTGMSGVTVEVLDTAAMERLGMGSILGVGRGSERPPRMLIVRYAGSGASARRPVVLAGKGITFDSGGISIKPSANMGDMKFDMSGAASVTATVLSLAGSRAPVNVVAIAALAENMPGGAAIRPGDVLRAMNGRTIEIVSTDAEGRLVLADALSWADAKLKPAAIVDVATLTGAMVTALGDDYAGVFSRDDALAARIEAAGKATGEAVWRMPLHESYAKDLASDYADLKNGGGSGAGAGTGAHFIGAFVGKETPWAHIDIAGVAWAKGASDIGPAGSTGWGVRLLDRFVRDFDGAR